MRSLAPLALLLLTSLSAARAETRLPLAAESALAATIAPHSLEAPGSGRVPAYVRVVGGSLPGAAVPLARLVRTFLFGGTVAPSIKLAMGRVVAQRTGCGYVEAHLSRLARALPAQGEKEHTAAQALAVGYAAELTRDIHGVDPTAFARLRGAFNDAQIIELTLATCFFNYFTRLCSGLGLEKEPWLDQAPTPPSRQEDPLGSARVTLLSDAEIVGVAELAKSGASNALGVGIPNSRRAMVRVPDLGAAWFDYWSAVRQEQSVPRTTLLQVSLAVSTLNGCRYCTLHQVVGLRRQGVDIARLLDLKKSDDALTDSEKAAVLFARKLTATPAAVTDQDFTALQGQFPGAKALEIVLQTCAFAFMNRFTDGLRLPSEDEAVRIYKEVYQVDPAKVSR